MIHFSKETFQEALKNSKPIFVDFYAVWCGPCMLLAPIFENMADKYKGKAVFGSINIDELRDVAIQYRVSSIPTVLCIKNKEVIWTNVGLVNEKDFKIIIDKILGE